MIQLSRKQQKSLNRIIRGVDGANYEIGAIGYEPGSGDSKVNVVMYGNRVNPGKMKIFTIDLLGKWEVETTSTSETK